MSGRTTACAVSDTIACKLNASVFALENGTAMSSEARNFELGDEDDTPTKQFSSVFDVSGPNEDALGLLVAGSSIGRYQIRRRVGRGGFGVVFLAEDSVLKRDVFIKVSRTPRDSSKESHFTLVAEAQAAASLDHPNIVRVFDTGQWNEYPYLVMEYVAGATLANEIRSSKMVSVNRALMLMEQVAMALVHLHTRGLIHRDLKPANILISPSDVIKLTDFGLAISDEMPIWNKQHIAGTNRYMAPEQVLGETHRIDGRTDIWGFGVVLYELLTSKPPFRSTDPKTLFESILKGDAASLRQRRPDIPHSLDLFCLRCLSQCMSDRFQSATEMLEDLATVRNCLEDSQPLEQRGVIVETTLQPPREQRPMSTSTPETDTSNRHSTITNINQSEIIGMVPRGLRSFEDEDHEFFLKLIPGPRGAQDMPVSLRFWKKWIASNDGNVANAVGILYGPSGSGKSSFIKAGLMPSIRESTTSIYVDFTVNRPVEALLSQLKKEFPKSASQPDLTSALASIRNATRDRTTVLILDQFEQYLANTPLNLQHELVQSLRQCDGKRLKAILLVRDEFWNSISHFMHLMESSLADLSNALSLPLLNQRHAERVLEAIGRAYENLPSLPDPISERQQAFIEQSVQLLSNEGLVICVRLAMFAELMRSREWDPKTLISIGGVDGAAIKYLKESFDVQTAPISRRSVSQSCREILRCLLPTRMTDLKSCAKSKDEIRSLVGQGLSPFEFEHAIYVLESELRLISAIGQGADGKPLISLAHDYLVRPIKDWIFEHEQSTWQGRARTKLVNLTAQYESDPSPRNLPTIAEWFSIQRAVPIARRSPTERQVLGVATRVVLRKFATIAVAALLFLSVASYAMIVRYNAQQSEVKKAITAVELFLASKPSGLETASKGVLDQLQIAKKEFSRKVFVGEESFDHRLALLGSLVGANVDTEKVVRACVASDQATCHLWRVAFQNTKLRDSVLQVLKKEPKISPKLHWPFLANDDFRLVTYIETSETPSPLILCHQIAACAIDDFEPNSWNSRKLEALASKELMKPELHLLATLLIGLLKPLNEVALDRIEQQANACDAAIAMNAQWYLSITKDPKGDFSPSEPEKADWKIERPSITVSIPMIHLQTGTMTYTKPNMDSNNKEVLETVVTAIVDNIWVAQERLEFELATRFVKSQQVSDSIEINDRYGYAAFKTMKSICLFCNLLSQSCGYERAYEFDDSESAGRIVMSPNVFWKPQANGFRIPTVDERNYIATCGNYRSIADDLLSNPSYFDRTRNLSQNSVEIKPARRSVPNPWGFSNTTSYPPELLFNANRLILSSSFISLGGSSNLEEITIQPERVNQTSLRLVRGPCLIKALRY